MKKLLLVLAFLTSTLPVRAGEYVRFLQESADEGEAEAQFILGLAYRDGWEGAVQPGSIAARWCELAIEMGDSRPAYVLNQLIREKGRVEKDEAQALRYLAAAAGRGVDYACVLLGEMLLEGNGVAADWPRGAEWMRKAATAGFAPAQFRLGIIYLVGDISTPKNEIEALAWFIVAAEAGSRIAEEFRDQRTELLGREAARLAVKRSRMLLLKDAGPVDQEGS
jgi:hypothetical protein